MDTDEEQRINSELKKTRERHGMILDDQTAIGAQNLEYLPIKYKKDGTPTAHSEKYLYTREGWDKLMDTVGEAVKCVSGGMRSGDIHAAAKQSGSDKLPCEYCEYKPICRIKFK